MIVSEFLATLGVRLDRGSFAKAEQSMSGLGKAAAAVAGGVAAAFAAGKFEAFIHDLTAQGAALHDQSDRLGISTERLQEYGLAAKLAGSSSEALEQGLRLVSRNAQAAEDGGKAMAKAFAGAGIALKNADGSAKTSDELLEGVADALQKTKDPAERTALAMRLLGRSGAGLIPLLKDGAEGLRAARQEAVKLGGGLSGETIAAADELDDNIARLNFSLLSLKSILGATLLPLVNKFVRALIGLSTWVRETQQRNKFLQFTLYTLAAALTAVGVQAAWAAREALVAWSKAAAPFVLAAIAVLFVAAALDDVRIMLRGGKSLLGEFLDKWNGIGTTNELVKNWAAGIRELTEALRELIEVGDPSKLLGTFKEIANFFRDTSATRRNADARIAELQARLAAEQDPAKKQAIGEQLAGELRRKRDFERGPSAVERATNQGLGAGVEEIRAGQASKQTAAESKAAATGFAQLFGGADISAPAEVTASVSGGGGNVSATTNVTVNAQTGASARDIAREAKRAAVEANARQAEDVKRALAGRRP